MEWDSPSRLRYHLNRSGTTDMMARSSALHGRYIFRNSINKYIRFSCEICVRLVRLVCAMPGGPKARAEALMHKHTSRSHTRTKQTAARASCTKRALGPAAAHVPPFMPGDQKGCGLPVAQLAGVPKARAAHHPSEYPDRDCPTASARKPARGVPPLAPCAWQAPTTPSTRGRGRPPLHHAYDYGIIYSYSVSLNTT